MSKYVLALDQGTTSSRAIIFDQEGNIVSLAQRPIDQIYPHPGWVNQDAEHIWEVTLSVMKEAVQQSQLDISQIAAIGITNQRETTILWDRATGKPVGPAIVWQSRQTSHLVDDIFRRGKAERYQQITGLVPDAYFSATKILWMLEQDPEVRRRAEQGDLAFGTVDSWLLWKLSGGKVHLTDYSNASRTMLFDINELKWSNELLADLNIPRHILPGLCDNSGIICHADSSILGAEIPVAGVAGDQQAALFGQTCFSPGEAKNTYGTGSFCLMNIGEKPTHSKHKLLTTIAWGINGKVEYALEGSIFVTGAAVGWLRDGLGIIKTSEEVEQLASSVKDSGGVFFVPAMVGLGAPYWDQYARGTIIGITRSTTAAHIARATLEAIAFQTRDVVEAMIADSGIDLHELRVDGGAVKNNLLLQIQADILGVPVVRPTMTEVTALGAAYLAGLATDVWADQQDLKAHWKEDRRFEPSISADQRESLYSTWKRAVERACRWEKPTE